MEETAEAKRPPLIPVNPKKHKYNIFPEMLPEDYIKLKNDLMLHGYDSTQPIYLFENEIIDGWNRYKACKELNIKPVYTAFKGNREEAMNFVMRTNKRRNLTSAQWACIAVEAEDFIKVIKAETDRERRTKQGESLRAAYELNTKSPHKSVSVNNLTETDKDDNSKRADHKVAEVFNTNRTYVNKAAQLKKENPQAFEALKTGEKSFNDIKKEERIAHKEEIKSKAAQIDLIAGFESEKVIDFKYGDIIKLGRHFLYHGNNTDKAFIDFLPKAKFAFADPPYNSLTAVAEWDKNFTWNQDYLLDKTELVAVTPGTNNIFGFAANTSMPYRWSLATWITNGMTRGALGFQNWIYTALFSKKESIFQNGQDFFQITISTSETEETSHKGRKPSQYMATIIDWFSKENDIVIDPFLGSGTTLLTCEKLNRVCYGAELEKEYCLEIISRYEKLSGQKAEVCNAVLY